MPDIAVSVPPALRRALAQASLGGDLATWTYLTVQGDRARSEHWLEDRRERLRTSLWAEGSPEYDVMAIDDALIDAPTATGRLNRYILASRGRIVLDEMLPGPLHGHERQGHGFVPDVIPVLRHLATDVETLAGGHGRRPRYVEGGVDATVSALRGGRAAVIVLDPTGFGEQSLDCLDAAPWLAHSGLSAQDAARFVSSAPTAVGLVRAALQGDVEIAFAPSEALPGGAPVAYLGR